MKYDLPERVERDICKFAEKHGIIKIILFGSRARMSNTERSDIDIAVSGGDLDALNSLLMFDIVDIDSGISEELKEEIKRDGVTIYEKTR